MKIEDSFVLGFLKSFDKTKDINFLNFGLYISEIFTQ